MNPRDRGVRKRRRPGGQAGFRRLPFLFTPYLFAAALFGCQPEDREGPEASSPEASAQASQEITAMLHASAASWNAGDLEGFLDDYWRSEELSFSGAEGVTRGWDDVRARYLRTYWAPEVERDSLRFEGLEVRSLGTEHALVLGQYVLFQPPAGDSVAATGFFSLVLRRLDGEWKIVHDHTSATPSGGGEEEGGS